MMTNTPAAIDFDDNERTRLQAEVYRLREELWEVSDFARTPLPTNYIFQGYATSEEWKTHRLWKIANMCVRALEKGK
jgi:hypothetical protein